MTSFGFTNFETIIFGLPGLAIAFGFVIGPALIVNRWPTLRVYVGVFVLLVCVASFLFTGLAPVSTDKWTKWALFMFAQSYAGPMFLMWPLMTINVGGRTKKAWLSATSLMTYCVGNIIGSQVMRPSDAPRYTKGVTGCAVVMLFNCVLMLSWRVYYVRTNKKRDAKFAESGMTLEEQDYQRKLAGEADMTDIEVSLLMEAILTPEHPFPVLLLGVVARLQHTLLRGTQKTQCEKVWLFVWKNFSLVGSVSAGECFCCMQYRHPVQSSLCSAALCVSPSFPTHEQASLYFSSAYQSRSPARLRPCHNHHLRG